MDVNLQKAQGALVGEKPKQQSDAQTKIQNIGTYVSSFVPGQLICFYYDAKMKKTLPYWDKFPLIFPIRVYRENDKEYILGINFHYLHPFYRARLMDALQDCMNNRFYNQSTRMEASYQTLKAASKYRLFKPCLKKYLISHVKSQFLMIDPQFWNIALMLPLQQFQKAPAEQVWAESAAAV
jgi:hypothetical protein